MALTLLAANNAQTVLAAGISSSATSLTVNTGTGDLFPAAVSGISYFKLTLIDAATGALNEIVHVTSRSGDVFTIQRGQEGTIARAWSANDIAANMMTAGTLTYLLTNFQPLDPTLSTIAALATAANKLPYFSGVDIAALTDLTSVGRDIIGKAAITDVLTYLGFTFGTNWIRFPSGHILQYGFAGGFDSYTVVLPVPYSTNSYAALAGGSGALSGGDSSRVFVETGIVDNGSFTAVCINAAGVRNARGINWIAFGK